MKFTLLSNDKLQFKIKQRWDFSAPEVLIINQKADTFIIFYHMYRKYFTNYTSYKEISTKDDLYGIILSLLKDNEADPEAIKEKIIFE